MIRLYDILYLRPDLITILIGNLIQMLQLSLKCFHIKVDWFSDMDQLVWGILHSFFIHQQLLIELFARAKPRKYNGNIYIRCVAGKLDQVFARSRILTGSPISSTKISPPFA